MKNINFLPIVVTGFILASALSFYILFGHFLLQGDFVFIPWYKKSFNKLMLIQSFFYICLVSLLMLHSTLRGSLSRISKRFYPTYSHYISLLRGSLSFFSKRFYPTYSHYISLIVKLLKNPKTYLHILYIAVGNIFLKLGYRFFLSELECIWLYPVCVFYITLVTILVISHLWNTDPNYLWPLVISTGFSIFYILGLFEYMNSLSIIELFSWFMLGGLERLTGLGSQLGNWLWMNRLPTGSDFNSNNMPPYNNNNGGPSRGPNNSNNNYLPSDNRSERERARGNHNSLANLLSPDPSERKLPIPQGMYNPNSVIYNQFNQGGRPLYDYGPGDVFGCHGSTRVSEEIRLRNLANKSLVNKIKPEMAGLDRNGEQVRTGAATFTGMREMPEPYVQNPVGDMESRLRAIPQPYAHNYSPDMELSPKFNSAIQVNKNIKVPGGQPIERAINKVTSGYYDGQVIRGRAFRLLDLYLIVVDNLDDLIIGRNAPNLTRQKLFELRNDAFWIRYYLKETTAFNGKWTFDINTVTREEKKAIMTQMARQDYVIVQKALGKDIPDLIAKKRTFWTNRWDTPHLQRSMRNND